MEYHGAFVPLKRRKVLHVSVRAGFVKRGLEAVGSRCIERLRKWTKPDNHGLVGGVVADATRSKSELMLENALLRQQVIVLDRQVERPQLSW
jgi:hypothetical protein